MIKLLPIYTKAKFKKGEENSISSLCCAFKSKILLLSTLENMDWQLGVSGIYTELDFTLEGKWNLAQNGPARTC